MRYLFLCWALCASMLGAGAVLAAPMGDLIIIETAQALLEPDGTARREGRVDLSRRWDTEFPGLGGRAIYRVGLPPRVGSEPMAVLFSRVGNQVHVQLNGHTVQRWGLLGDSRFDASKSAVMVVLPAALLYTDRPNELSIEVTIQRQRLGGMSVLRYGPQWAIAKQYDEQLRWRDFPLLVFAATLVGMGGLTALLWWYQREPIFGWFSLTAFVGVAPYVYPVWPDVPVPWPYLGALNALCYACHSVLICRFALMALGPISSGMKRVFNTALGLTSALAALSFALAEPRLQTLGLALLIPLGVTTFALIIREALRGGSSSAWILTGAGAIAVAAGVYDFLLVRIGHTNGLRNTLSQHALFAFVLIMGGLLAVRYNRSVADYLALNADLARRVAERERQLNEAFEALRVQQHEQSVQTERERIMREIHDGVGSQLVGLLNMVTRPGADPLQLQEQVQQALDEMRMAVDSLQPVHDDLVTVLATLRYRLQPRLQAAGIAVVWDVAELPALPQLSPQAVLQVQRILLEAFTNVLKHARATQVTVLARWRDGEVPLVTLQIADNGVGLGSEASAQERGYRARGIQNMRARATAIGALLRVEQSAGSGVCVALDWPVERELEPGMGA